MFDVKIIKFIYENDDEFKSAFDAAMTRFAARMNNFGADNSQPIIQTSGQEVIEPVVHIKSESKIKEVETIKSEIKDKKYRTLQKKTFKSFEDWENILYSLFNNEKKPLTINQIKLLLKTTSPTIQIILNDKDKFVKAKGPRMGARGAAPYYFIPSFMITDENIKVEIGNILSKGVPLSIKQIQEKIQFAPIKVIERILKDNFKYKKEKINNAIQKNLYYI